MLGTRVTEKGTKELNGMNICDVDADVIKGQGLADREREREENKDRVKDAGSGVQIA